MSLYPQSTAYNQMAYPPQGYGAPVPPPNAYYPPPPAPQPVYQHFDPNTFRRDYATRLSNLTVNSRPIIQSLSMIAQEFTRFADVVVQCIEQHIRRVPAWMKLPAFYLLDAISKNVYDPYARHFSPVVANLFIETYEAVDPTTRSKMEEMLLTWRNGAPNNRELFGVVPQLAIEQHIWGSGASHNAVRTSRRRPKRTPHKRADQSGSRATNTSAISQAQVLSELEFVLAQKERTVQSNPYDKTTQHHVNILQQLRSLVQVGVSQEELKQILAQLRALATTATPAMPPPAPAPAPAHYASAPSYAPPPPMPPAPPPAPQHSYAQHSYSVPPEQPKVEQIDLSRFLTSQPAPTASTSTAAPVSDITNLFNALVKAGVVGTPTNAGATSKSEERVSSVDPQREAVRAYRKSVLSHKIKLTSSDITRQRPPIVNLLYQNLPTQCKQCAVRFPGDARGKKLLEDHLDMHFRQNRKASQAIGRGHSRSWFVTLEDWVHSDSVDVKGKGRADGRSLTSKAAVAEEAAKREAELRAMHVVVPPGDEAKPISCPICKEHLKSEFLEDDEEWVWRNAVKKDDRIYHATCHAEAVASKSTLAVRLRNETSSRSRSHTPETPKDYLLSESPSPSRRAGLKRKAEDESANPATNEMDAPQVKRVAT
ncbi:uncharacterized protein TRAVEDRAFT_57146 [Trametes versicolor FP-101664 SS1]|uniref:uncharacterized protein n=1 Tax=Trametes versicolor (strain FP-101664) TaxID=717944 RepID=UPI000462448D|nr:uncharacterized protein TRAVEDRAFT_57146 [Trametes versicolor FP-101664 SS1]EIW62016.1 hypothetical protein TRAVEDRAFT_57146 [Trametes versicolor FP-101664 SS1]